MANVHHGPEVMKGVRACAGLVAAVALSASGATAQTPQSALPATYAAAMKCFVANSHARGQRLRAGDDAKAEYYKGKGAQAYEAARTVGTAMGYPQARINADADTATSRQLPTMVKDSGYFLAAVADCKAMGLM